MDPTPKIDWSGRDGWPWVSPTFASASPTCFACSEALIRAAKDGPPELKG